MKIFISWSGNSSRMVARALNDWLPRVIQAVKPFHSSEIDKGAKWSNEIEKALEDIHFGIVCLTPDNLDSPWIHYEVGALSKTNDASIWTFLLELKPADVRQPLGKYQHTLAEEEEVLKLLQTINSKLTAVGIDPLKDSMLVEIFREAWPKLQAKLGEAALAIDNKSQNKSNISDEDDWNKSTKLDEILDLLRNQQRQRDVTEVISKKNATYQARSETLYKGMDISLKKNDSEYSQVNLETAFATAFPVLSIEFSESRSTVRLNIMFKVFLPVTAINASLKVLRDSIDLSIYECAFITDDGRKALLFAQYL